MTIKEMYRVWAPEGKKWVDWVRPVAFVKMSDASKEYHVSMEIEPALGYSAAEFPDAAVIVDLPGAESVRKGIALAQRGYRPIPIFNGTVEQQGARATVDNQSVRTALRCGTPELAKTEISDEALPAFLLDRNRLQRFKMAVSLFDNSWDVYPQDIPSADYFVTNGINKIIVVGDSVAKDLKKILYKYQKKNIEIFLAKGYEEPKKVILHRTLGKEKD